MSKKDKVYQEIVVQLARLTKSGKYRALVDDPEWRAILPNGVGDQLSLELRIQAGRTFMEDVPERSQEHVQKHINLWEGKLLHLGEQRREAKAKKRAKVSRTRRAGPSSQRGHMVRR